MRRPLKSVALLALLLAADCRTPPPGPVQPDDTVQPTGPAPTEPTEPATPAGTAAARAPLPRVDWGEPAAKYAACPKALCERQADAAAVRGCEVDAVDLAPPVPPPVAAESQSCRASHGGLPAVRSRSVTVGGYGAASLGAPPPEPVMAQATTTAISPLEAGALPDEDDVATELVVVARDVDLRRDDRPAAATEGAPAAPTQGALRATNRDGAEVGEFPLEHTEVSADVTGYIGRTVVEQTYGNPFDEVIEAVYVFPLPGMSAVNDFVMEVGARKIVGLVRPREEAEQIYAQARARGQTASLLTQERPNIFTQSVANIEPGGKVVIRITYFERLVYQHGTYEFVFPMVVGPRYIPGGAAEGAAGAKQAPPGGGGTSAPTDRVPDADRITPPVLRPGERSGHDIGLTLAIDAGLPIAGLQAVTHCVEVEDHSTTRKVLRLAAADSIPNRDFVVRWKVDGAETQFGVLAHRGEQGGFLTLLMQPPLAPADAQVTPREITFLIDVSGSQSGLPLGLSKEIVRRTLDELRPEDAFNIYFFASGNGQLWERPRPNNRANVQEAREFLDELCGGGGTEMLEGVRRALGGEHDAKFLQMYVFLTDGYIGNEEEILRVIKEERGEARFFAFGTGSSVNRYLIDGIGEFGGGASHVVLPRDEDQTGRAVQRLFELIDSPVLVDVKIDWNGLPVEDVYPSKLPDLFAGQTINVVARYSRAARGTAYVEARVGAARVRLPVDVDLPEAQPDNPALAPIWARWRIDELSDELVTAAEGRRTELTKQITELAVDFRLVSQFTAFVAVDESRIVGDGNPLRVIQPVELPEGVSYEGVFGERPMGAAFEVPAWGVTLQETESGRIRIGAVRLGSPAAAAGVAAGAIVSTVDRTVVHGLEHLEGLVLQGAESVTLELEPGGPVTLPRP
jgi:Ca-activated chloride channel family protein